MVSVQSPDGLADGGKKSEDFSVIFFIYSLVHAIYFPHMNIITSLQEKKTIVLIFILP